MDGKSKDLTREYIEQIRTLFPEVVTEVADNEGGNISRKVDMEKLALLLGEAAIPADEIEYRQKFGEKFSFEWAGKRRAIAEAQKRSTGTLRPCAEESVDWDTTENLYIEGDNLEVLKLLQDSYLGAVKMIYIDPPYNTGKDFVYKDNYKDNLSNYLEQTNTTNAVNSESSGRYHTNWLNMMYPRLKLARNLLTDDGVIFISIDDNEVSNLKSICDEIFGEDNFVSKLIWKSRQNKDNRNITGVSIDHEYVLCYGKKTSMRLFIGEERKLEQYKNPDNDLRGAWTSGNMVGLLSEDQRPNCHYDLINPNTGVNYGKPQMGWRYDMNTMTRLISEDRILWPPTSEGRPRRKVFLSDISDNAPAFSSIIGNNIYTRNGTSEICELFGNKSFDYPKPTNLLSILQKQITTNNDIILDFFSGSATTAHAVMQLNAEDGENRKYICVQLPEQTPEDSEARKAGYATIPEIAKERIRRAGKKIIAEQLEKAPKKGENTLFGAEEVPDVKLIDAGFKVFKLDRSNVKEWDVEFDGLSEREAQEALSLEFEKAMDILKDGRTELDLLYEVMLKLGLQLTTHVEEKEIDGKKAYLVGNGVMVASFAKGLTYSEVSKILDLKPDFIQSGEFKVVLSDESFASDNDKTNAMQLFKQRGITNYEII